MTTWLIFRRGSASLIRLVRACNVVSSQFATVAHCWTNPSNPTPKHKALRRYTNAASNCSNDNKSKDILPFDSFVQTHQLKPYLAGMVNDAIVSVFTSHITELNKADNSKMYFEFVHSHSDALYYLDAFVRHSSPGLTVGIMLLTLVELTNTLFVFKDLLKKNKLPKMDVIPPSKDLNEGMIEALFVLLFNNKSGLAQVPVIVGKIINAKETIDAFQKLFEAGLGKFLPEISMLPKQFDLQKLTNFQPIIEGISLLKLEFTDFYQFQNQSFDSTFYKTLIPVMRYVHLLVALEYLNATILKPLGLVTLINKTSASEVQSVLYEISGESSECDQLMFGTYRNFLNLVFCANGLDSFDNILSFLLKQLYSGSYSEIEKSQIFSFFDTFIPLLTTGNITNNELGDVKYGCVVARYRDNVLVPYKIGANVFDNYEFSLMVLLDLADYFYVLRSIAPQLNKPFKMCSFDEIKNAIEEFGSGKGVLVREDIMNLLSAVKVYSAYSLRGFSFFDRVVMDQSLISIMELLERKHKHISELNLKIIDLTGVNISKPPRTSLAGADKYGKILSEFREFDTGVTFSELSVRNLIRLLKLKLRLLDETNKTALIEQYQELILVMSSSLQQGGFEISNLDKFCDTVPVIRFNDTPEDVPDPEYVQIPDDLHIHEFADELLQIKQDLNVDFKDLTSEEIIAYLKSEVEDSNNDKQHQMEINKIRIKRFSTLANKLCRLFTINGNDTEVLDAIIRSNNVFHKFEAVKKELKLDQQNQIEKHANVDNELYHQVPANCPIHSFVSELTLVQEKLGRKFGECSSEAVLKQINDMADQYEASGRQKESIVFEKLRFNLEALFSHNNNHTCVLDAIITSGTVFDQLEKTLNKQREESSKAYTMASYQKELAAHRVVNRETINPAVPLKNDAPNETSATAEQEDLKLAGTKCPKPLVKNDLEQFLRKANNDKRVEEEEKFREREAYIWSASMLRKYGTLETKQFFTSDSKNKFPMFPGIDNNVEYLVLTANGHRILSPTNPLGATHVPEDMLSVLERLSESDIVKFSPYLAKLQRRRWCLVGSGSNNQMLVFSRLPRNYSFSVLRTAKLLVTTAGFVFITLLGLNYILDEPTVQGRTSLEADNKVCVAEDPLLVNNGSSGSNSEPQSKSWSWFSFLWK